MKSRKRLVRDVFDSLLLPHIPILFMTSLTQTAEQKKIKNKNWIRNRVQKLVCAFYLPFSSCLSYYSPPKKKKKGSADKPAHAHLRRFNIDDNYVNITVIMYFLTYVSRWEQCFKRNVGETSERWDVAHMGFPSA